MSRSDSQEFDLPLGFDLYRSHASSGDLHPPPTFRSAQAPVQDRRLWHHAATHASWPSNVPRSATLTEQPGDFTDLMYSAPNRHNSSPPKQSLSAQSLSSYNYDHPRPSPPPLSQSLLSNALYHTPLNDRSPHSTRNTLSSTLSTSPLSPSIHSVVANSNPILSISTFAHSPNNNNASHSTLLWASIEPWMDEEYAKQVCDIMGWDQAQVKVPHPAPDANTGQQANNPGYCFLTFPSPAQAAAVLAQINNSTNGPIVMPNSSKPFVLNWAPPFPASTFQPNTPTIPAATPQPQNQYQKEYSIFVGDLAPETSNSDLVAVFRNPVLGLRNDREPKFIRPFLSCKSAKIMLDPVTGVSRGYGFVRFTDEVDQQRALIEMHGLYCLSRPMRISPATAKYKHAPSQTITSDISQIQYPVVVNSGTSLDPLQPVTVALPFPVAAQTKSVSAPIASTTSNNSLATNSVTSSGSGSSIGGSNSTNSVNSTTTSAASSLLGSVTSEDIINVPNNILAQIAQQYANSDSSIRISGGQTIHHLPQDIKLNDSTGEDVAPRYVISEESWKHHAQARAILGNLIGPNGEQLTSTDPYNTTVFVGGLSPLISEETLRTFFAPFGDIHYVKVPVGKHCGFVQFVRKADAERAIEKMQGFPIGGSRIRLSWGRSQYKAAQAAAQAAQNAALQAQYPSVQGAGPLSQEQAMQFLQKLAAQGFISQHGQSQVHTNSDASNLHSTNYTQAPPFIDEKLRASLGSRDDTFEYIGHNFGGRQEDPLQRMQTSFSPFSPELNVQGPGVDRRQSVSASRSDGLPHPSKGYASGFYPSTQDLKLNLNSAGSSGSLNRVSPTSTRLPSASRYGSFLENSAHQVHRTPGRAEAPISRLTSDCTIRAEREGGQDFDVLQDLNGTLASLDLSDSRPWNQFPTEGTASNTSQFRAATNTTSPLP